MKNGTLGTLLAVAAGGDGAQLTVRLDGPGGSGGAGSGGKGAGPEGRDGSGAVVTFSVRDYAHVEHGYAATIHKAQGVTADQAHVLASGHMDRHAAYVALTRHRDGVALHYGRDEFADGAALARTLGRERRKDTSLDYDALSSVPGREGDALAGRYAERRGLDPLHPVSEIVVRTPERTIDPRVEPKGKPVVDAALEQAVAAGRAGFRERYEAHRRQQEVARDEVAARALVGRWATLTKAYEDALPRLAIDPNPDQRREGLLRFGRGLPEQPAATQLLRERGEAFGMAAWPNLARVLADPQPERAVAGIMATLEFQMRAQLRQTAEREAARQRELEARQQEREARQRPRPSRGPSLGR